MNSQQLQTILLSLKLASIVTFLLIIFCIPLAWWLARSKTLFKFFIESVVSLPLVLPPTVLGFYFLMAMGAEGPLGQISQALGIGPLAFTFKGLVIASFIYSLPFVIRPIQNSFESIGRRSMEVAATLGASPLDSFFNVALPMAKKGIISALILGFCHTLGEFGVILIIGGNIPNETKVLAIDIYDHVEALEYQAANQLSLVLVIFSFLAISILNYINRNNHSERYGL